MVSILVTTYNCEKYIDKAISSVVTQEMPFEWELLIGDDGSSDMTQEIINSWTEKYPDKIKLFVMKRDSTELKSGTRAARNRAHLLEKAVGDYLIFLDGDDQFIGTEKIKRQVEILERDTEQKYACVAHNIIANSVSDGKQYPLVSENLKEGPIDLYYYWKYLYFHTNTIMFRSSCKNLMLNARYRDFLNDNFITFIIMQHGGIYYLNELWAQYNLTGDGLWTGKKRTFGCFRNLIIYDLQLSMNKSFSYASFIRHLYDFRYIFKYYDLQERDRIKSLLSDLDEDLFHYTFLMYKNTSEMSCRECIEKMCVFCRVIIAQHIKKICNVINKFILKMK